MPPRDPRLCPDLEVARPDDFTGARSEPVTFPEPWEIRFGGENHEWRNATVIYRWTAADGREIVEVQWSVDGMLRTGTFFAATATMRRRWLGGAFSR